MLDHLMKQHDESRPDSSQHRLKSKYFNEIQIDNKNVLIASRYGILELSFEVVEEMIRRYEKAIFNWLVSIERPVFHLLRIEVEITETSELHAT